MGDSAAGDHADQCRSCPVCVVLRALDDLRPEVRSHVVAAGRELVQALRAAVDDVGNGPPSGDDVWAAQRCGTSPHTPPQDGRARQQPAPATPLRRIPVE